MAAAAPKQQRICVVGACFTDLIAYAPRMPGPGETLAGSKFSSGFGGKGANQAVQAARLGADVMMISKVGADTFGADTLKNFREQGVDARHVKQVQGESSGVAPIVVNEVTGENSIIIVPGALNGLGAADVAAAREDIRGCSLLMAQLEAPLEATMAALKLAKEEGVTTLLNTAPAKALPDEIFGYCDIVCPNEPELQMLTGLPTTSNEEVRKAAEVLMGRGAKKVLVTLGSRGCALFAKGEEPVFVEGSPAKAVDTTGAGDSFLGAFAAAFVQGNSLEQAMRRGNEVAAVSVTRRGTQLSFPTLDELDGGEVSAAKRPRTTDNTDEGRRLQAIGLIDHTSLGDGDTEAGIKALVDAAVAEEPHTAAVCIYPKFVKFIRDLQAAEPRRYPRTLKVCTVVNFPSGQEPREKVLADTRAAVAAGADEVDLVIDYKLLKQDLEKGRAAAEALVKDVRAACPTGQVLLKVIIEAGELGTTALITAASESAIAGGCDFIKTSTGKVKVNATLENAEPMLRCCRAAADQGRQVGFKAAGGVKTFPEAKTFLELAGRVLFDDASRAGELDARRFRFGASSLLANLRRPAGAQVQTGGY